MFVRFRETLDRMLQSSNFKAVKLSDALNVMCHVSSCLEPRGLQILRVGKKTPDDFFTKLITNEDLIGSDFFLPNGKILIEDHLSCISLSDNEMQQKGVDAERMYLFIEPKEANVFYLHCGYFSDVENLDNRFVDFEMNLAPYFKIAFNNSRVLHYSQSDQFALGLEGKQIPYGFKESSSLSEQTKQNASWFKQMIAHGMYQTAYYHCLSS